MSISTEPQPPAGAAGAARPSPYIGPRAFKTGETLYGREREVMDLLDLLIAERIVLLYSPSGAGKTSLVQAALIPRLVEEGFLVLPPVRVSMEPPTLVKNRYTFSVLLSLEEGLRPDQHTPVSELAQMDLADYLARHPPPDGAPESEVLIFDQFEEILTIDPNDQAEKHAFFAQVGAALRDRRRWALFSMREDYVAALAPYLRPLPTRLSNTYRLDLLGEAAARAAAQQPASTAGVAFTEAAARKLIDDLRRVRVQQSEGTTEEQLGPYVEPVQLQVVCLRLWEHLPPDDLEIGEEDIAAVGDVDSALSGYYAERIAWAAATTGVSERAIREWCDRQLITEQGIRGQVLQGRERSQGLENRAIRMLIEAHLVRGEKRRGATWFELAHDRLIKPIQTNNLAWREAHLSPLQRQAALWDSQYRPDGLLLHDQELADAGQWAAGNADALTDVENAFLEACRENQRAIESSRRTDRIIRRLGIGAMVVSLLALVALAWAWIERNQAIDARGTASARDLMAQSRALLDTYPQRSLLLALEAYNIDQGNLEVNLHSEDALREALANAGGTVLRGHTKAVRFAAFSPDSRLIATASDDTTAILWKMDSQPPTSTVLRGHDKPISAIAFSPDGRWLATASEDTTARLWNVAAPTSAPLVLSGHDDALNALVISADSRWLVTASADKTARLWDLNALARDPAAPAIILHGHTDQVRAVAISSNGRWVVTGSVDDTARLWDLTAPDPNANPIVLRGHTDTIRAVAISPNGRWVVTASDDSTARVWRLAGPDPAARPIILEGHVDAIRAIAIGPNSRWLVTASDDSTARLWDLDAPDPAASAVVLRGHTDQIWTVAISTDLHWIVTGSRDITIRLWDLSSKDPSAAPIILRGHEDAITTVAISPDNRLLVSGNLDATPRLWGLNIPYTPAVPLVLHGHTSAVRAVPISPNGRWVVTASADGTAGLWDLTVRNPAARPVILRDHKRAIREAVISADSNRLVTVSDDQTARVWDLTAADPAANPIVLSGHTKSIWSVAISPDSRWVATGSRDNTVRIWDLNVPAANPLILSGHSNVIRTLAFSPDGHKLVSGSDDKTIRVWELTAQDPNANPLILNKHTGGIRMVAFSPDGRWLVSAGAGGATLLWDLRAPDPAARPRVLNEDPNFDVRVAAISPDGKWIVSAGDDAKTRLWNLDALTRDPAAQPFVLGEHTAPIRSISISADSHWLITAGEDTSARVWDLTARDPSRESTILPGHIGPVLSVGISPDGKWIVTGSQDSTAHLWTVVSQEEVRKMACQTAGRNLSQDEWSQYIRDGSPYRTTCPDQPLGENAPEEPRAGG